MRAVRNSLKTYALGAVALAALLSTAACDPNAVADDSGASPSSTPSEKESAKPGGDADADAEGSSGESGDSGDSEGDVGGDDGDGVDHSPLCHDIDFSITAKAYPHDELRHMLLTATNTADRACILKGYPVVRFEEGPEDQVGPLESDMQEVKIEPGKKAYAGMLLWRIDAPTDAVDSMTVSLFDDPEASAMDVPFPDGHTFVNVDDSPGVTYWNASREKAEKLMFSR